ncbi:MAG: DegT/DnrJ/EryC1/StrS family aminotransferase [Planctomycetota bacterium]
MTQRNVRVAEPVLDGNETAYVLECLRTNWISSRGTFIERFERLLADYCGVEHAVVTCNGTTSLHLALVANGIGPGDEVIMPTLSYVATANVATYCQAVPVFVDCEPKSLCMDPEKIEAAITPRTKAIMTVPLYGHPVNMDPILAIADRHGLAVVEDAAESLGAEYKGRRVGSLSQCASFSFFGNKTITTGEGGAITTDDAELAQRMRFLRGQAVDPNKNYWHPEVGFNYRMTNIAAAIGTAQAERLAIHVQRRQQVARWYFEELQGLQDIFQLPYSAKWAKHSYWMYTVLMRPEHTVDRDDWIKELAARGVESRPVFYPIHTMPAYVGSPGEFPVAERCAAFGINLPTHGNLTRDDVTYVCEQAVQAWHKLRYGRVTRSRAA